MLKNFRETNLTQKLITISRKKFGTCIINKIKCILFHVAFTSVYVPFGNLIDICNKHKHEKQWKNSEKFPHELVRTHITPIERFYDLL